MDTQPDTKRNWILMALGGAAVAAVLILAVLFLTKDDGEVSTTTSTSTTVVDETTTTSPEETTTTFASTVSPAAPLFPDPGSSRRFDDPVAVALAWVTEVVGFVDPIVDPFQPGDGRSGEVAIRSVAEGAPTAVLVRQLEDDTWFVIGATTDSIRLSTPAPGATIRSPQPLAGAAYAFEGTVSVRLFVDGVAQPIARSTVTGRGDGVLGDFAESIDFTAPAGARYGVLLLSEASARDGATVAATAIRVAFT